MTRRDSTQGNQYKYYVRLAEKKENNKYYGIELENNDNIKESSNTANIKNFTKTFGLSETANNVSILKSNTAIKNSSNELVKNICSEGIDNYYTK